MLLLCHFLRSFPTTCLDKFGQQQSRNSPRGPILEGMNPAIDSYRLLWLGSPDLWCLDPRLPLEVQFDDIWATEVEKVPLIRSQVSKRETPHIHCFARSPQKPQVPNPQDPPSIAPDPFDSRSAVPRVSVTVLGLGCGHLPGRRQLLRSQPERRHRKSKTSCSAKTMHGWDSVTTGLLEGTC